VGSSSGRTVRAIESGLEKLGLIAAEQRNSRPFQPTIAIRILSEKARGDG